MTLAQHLLELQDTDLRLAAVRRRLEQVAREAQDDLGLGEAGERERQAGEELRRLQHAARDAELRAEEVEQKLRSVEGRLYDGSVRNPRELRGMEEELGQLKRARSAADDEMLDLMGRVEDAEREAGAAGEKRRERERERDERVERLREERSRLEQEREELERRRGDAASRVGQEGLRLYERVRAASGGVGVARLERGTCQACHLALPTGEAQRIRNATSLTYCSSCGRILLPG